MDGYSWSIQAPDVVWKIEEGEDRIQSRLSIQVEYWEGVVSSRIETKLSESSRPFQTILCIVMVETVDFDNFQ